MTSISETPRIAEDSRVDLEAAGGVAAATPPVRRRKPLGSRWRMRLEILALAGPALIVFVTFVIFPVALAAYYGFFSWAGYGPATDFVGLRNYVTILQDEAFIEALRHNVIIAVLSLVIQGPIALGLALLLNRKMRGQSVIRVLIFVPYVISEVVVGLGWSLMLQSNGAANGLLEKVGLGDLQQDWLSDPNIAIWSLMLIITWKYIGFAVILFLAGLQGIPEELSEAASIDGASYWQVQRTIVLPLLGPTVKIWAFLSIIGSLQLFDMVWVTTKGGPNFSSATMATYLVEIGSSRQQIGYGTAVAVILFVISLVIALVYQRFALNRDLEGATTGKGR